MHQTVKDQIKSRLNLLKVILEFSNRFIDSLKSVSEDRKIQYRVLRENIEQIGKELDLIVNWYDEGTLSRSQLKEKAEPLSQNLAYWCCEMNRLLEQIQSEMSQEEKSEGI